ncbi:MAG: tripartite tricarboxylate transporter substrate binding protein [Proteobacteria bacterium]|nr:tripartite tricarboxylate transporter substrate binding protein [Burkholderiales bacterium]
MKLLSFPSRPVARHATPVRSSASAHQVAAMLLGAAASGAALQDAHAQPYPSRPITMVVPFAPGGTADVLGREFAVEMSKLLGQNVVVELRPGAGGNIGAEHVAKQSRADGHTLLLGSLSVSTNVSLMKLNWDPRKDLIPVAGIATVPNLLVVAADSPFKTVSDLISAAKVKAGSLFFGSSGPGTSSHLAGELFQDRAGVTITHVPYKGSGAVYPDIIGGRVTMLFDLAGSAVGQVKGGKVRALATTARRRSPAMPDVPAIAETFPGYEFGSWFALFAPAATPKDAVALLEQATIKSMQTERIKERLLQIAAEPVPNSSVDFAKFLANDIERYARLVREGRLDVLQ